MVEDGDAGGTHRTHRLSVRGHLLPVFAVCLVAVSALIVVAGAQADDRERERTGALLRAGALAAADRAGRASDDAGALVGQLARSRAIGSLDDPALGDVAYPSGTGSRPPR